MKRHHTNKKIKINQNITPTQAARRCTATENTANLKNSRIEFLHRIAVYGVAFVAFFLFLIHKTSSQHNIYIYKYKFMNLN